MKKFKEFSRSHFTHIVKKGNYHVDLDRGTLALINHDRFNFVKENSDTTDIPKFDNEKEFTNLNSHIGETPEKVSSVLNDHYNLRNHPQRDQILSYTNHSRDFNSELYQKHARGESPKFPRFFGNDTAKKVNALDKSLNSGKTPAKMTVFSGVKFHPGIAASKHPENKLFLPAFTSTSVDPKRAVGFASGFQRDSDTPRTDWVPNDEPEAADKHVIAFHLPEGHPGLHVQGVSRHKDEHEFILPRQTSWSLGHEPEIRSYKNAFGKIGRVHIWHATPS